MADNSDPFVIPQDAPADDGVPQIQFDPTVPVSPEHARSRAQDYANILGNDGPDVTSIYNRLLKGEEAQFRQEVTALHRQKLEAQRTKLLQDYVKGRGGQNITQDDVDYIRNLSSGQIAEAEAGDPNDYIERRLAQRVTDMVPVPEEHKDDPVFKQIKQNTANRLTAAAYAQKKLQELIEEKEQRTAEDPDYIPYFSRNTNDFLGMMISPLQWYRRQNLIAPNVSPSFWSGRNNLEQAQWYYRQDPKAAMAALDKAVDELKGSNLLNAIQFVTNIVDTTPFHVFMEDLQSQMDVAPFVGWVPYGAVGGLAARTLGKRILSRLPTRTPVNPAPGAATASTEASAIKQATAAADAAAPIDEAQAVLNEVRETRQAAEAAASNGQDVYVRALPDIVFNGDIRNSLERVFYNPERAEDSVGLSSGLFSSEEIKALERAGFATNGRMTPEQFELYQKEVSRRLKLGYKERTADIAAAQKQIDEAATQAPESVTFKTSRGSTYAVQADGTTIRDKAARNDVGHEGSFGPQPQSAKTYYIKPEDAQRLALPEGVARIVDHGDGTLSVATKNASGRWGISASQRNIPVSTEPQIGLNPVELWKKQKVNKLDAYSSVHLGNEITKITGANPAQVSETIPGVAYRRSAEAYEEAQRRIAALALETRGRSDAPSVWAEASGDLTTAGALTARDQLRKRAGETHGDDAMREFSGYARAYFNPGSVIFESEAKLANESAQHIYYQMQKNADDMTNALLNDPIEVPRLDPTSGAMQTAAADAYTTAVLYQFNHLADHILDARIITPRTNQALPPALAKKAAAAENLEREVQQYGWTGHYTKYEADENVLALDRAALRQYSKTGKNVDVTRVPKTIKDILAKNGKEEILERIARITKERKAMDAAQKKFFARVYKARSDYENAAKALDWPPNSRVEGFGARMPVGGNVKEGLGNVPYVEIPFGNADGTLFQSRDRAGLMARRVFGFRPGTFSIKKLGNKYYVSVAKTIDETSDSVRDALALELEKTPRPVLWQFLQPIFGGTTHIPSDIDSALKTMTYGSYGAYAKIAKIVRNSMLVPLKKESKEEQAKFLRFLEYQRVLYDPVTETRGVFSPNQAEFEMMWKDVNGTLPSANQSLSYWTYVQVSNIDKLLRDLSVYRDKARAGIENHEIRILGASAPLDVEGKIHTQIPLNEARDARAGFLVWDSRSPDGIRHVYINQKGGQQTIEGLMNSGYRLIQLTPHAQRDLASNPTVKQALDRIMAERENTYHPSVDFILTKELRSSPLPFQQTPNRAGGHHEYAFGWLIKQPDIRGNKYYGDTSLRGFEAHRRNDAQYFVERYEKARQTMNLIDRSEGRIPESVLEDYVNKNLPDTVEQFRNLFKNGQYNRDLPFLLTKDGESTYAAHKLIDRPEFKGLTNIQDSPLNLYNTSTLKFMMERGEVAMTIDKGGSAVNPTFALKPAPLVDALPTMDRAIQHLSRNMQMSDVQIKMAERFIAEFHDILQPELHVLRADPLHHLLNPVFRPGVDPKVEGAAWNYRRVAIETLGVGNMTPADRWYTHTQQKLADALYEAGWTKTAVAISPATKIKMIKNPVQAIRNGTGYYFLSDYTQFFIQLAGMLNIAAVGSIKLAGESLAAALYGRYVRDFTGVTGMLDEAAKQVGLFGWPKSHFIEAYKAGVDSGFFHVGRQHALFDDVNHTTHIKTGWFNTGLDTRDVIMTPFRKGEEIPRHMSWYAAYKQWRDANPTAIFDNAAKSQVVKTADRFAGNMSPVGMASIQRSFASIPITFWGYGLRQWEMMMGLDQFKLTKWQRAKAFLNYTLVTSMFYGAPAVGGVALFYPVASAVRQWVIDESSKDEPDRNPVINRMMKADDKPGVTGAFERAAFKIAFDGILGYIADGTNISERLSPGGNRFFADLLGDKTLVEILGGATGSAGRQVALATQPFIVFMMDSMRPAQSKLGAKITIEDVQRAIMAFGGRGVSRTMKAYWALTLGELMSNQRISTTPMTTPEAVIFSLTGLEPRRVGDAFAVLANDKALRQLQTKHTPFIIQAWRDMMKAAAEGRYDDAVSYSNQARVHISLGMFRPEQMPGLMGKFSRDQGSLVENVMQRFALQSSAHAEFYQKYIKQLEE